MSNLQAFVIGLVVAWTPSVLLVTYLALQFLTASDGRVARVEE
jgi:hypothetical protein